MTTRSTTSTKRAARRQRQKAGHAPPITTTAPSNYHVCTGCCPGDAATSGATWPSSTMTLSTDATALAHRIASVLEQSQGRTVVDRLVNLGYAELMAARACLEVYSRDGSVDLDRAVKWLRMHPNPDPNGDPMGGMLMATPLACVPVPTLKSDSPAHTDAFIDELNQLVKRTHNLPHDKHTTTTAASCATPTLNSDADASSLLTLMLSGGQYPGITPAPVGSTGDAGAAGAAGAAGKGLPGLPPLDAATTALLFDSLGPQLQTLIDTLASAAADPAAAPPPGAVERAIAKAAELQAATDKLAVVALQQQQALQQVLQQRGLELPLPTTSGGAGDRVPPPKAGGTQRAPVGAPQGTPLGTPLLPVRPDKPSTPPVGHKESGGPTVTEEGPVATGPSDADVLAPLVLNQHMSVEWQHEKEALQAEITRLQAHREWADAKIDQLISKAKKEQWPLLTETARLKEEVAALRAEKDGLEGKLKEFERSLYKLKDTTFKEAAAKRDYEKRVQAAEAELKGIMLRDSELEEQVRDTQQQLKQERKKREGAERQAKKAIEEKTDALTKLNALTEQVATLKSQLQQAKQTSEARGHALDEHRTNAAETTRALQLAHDDAMAQLTSMRSQLSRHDALVAQVASLQQEVQEARSAMESAREDATAATTRVAALEVELRSTTAALQGAQGTQGALQREVEAARQHAKLAVAALQELQQQQMMMSGGASLSSGTISSPDRGAWGSRGTTPDQEVPDMLQSSLYSHWTGSSLFSGGGGGGPAPPGFAS